jgi:hypothetical protein
MQIEVCCLLTCLASVKWKAEPIDDDVLALLKPLMASIQQMIELHATSSILQREGRNAQMRIKALLATTLK